MAIAVDKRKRAEPTHFTDPSSLSSNDDHDDAASRLDIFRRAFERKFAPLNAITQQADGDAEVEASVTSVPEDESDWDGIESCTDGENAVEVIEHKVPADETAFSKAELKAFMQSKPPISRSEDKPRVKQKLEEEEDEVGERFNLKNDLALQRLIDESHLLHPSASRDSGHKSKVLDKRLQTLGSKGSFMKQEKMPLAHRKGMAAKATERDDRRRKEARENGVILEKTKLVKKPDSDVKRVRGVGGPSVGKFRGGTLSLSKKDVASITGRDRR